MANICDGDAHDFLDGAVSGCDDINGSDGHHLRLSLLRRNVPRGVALRREFFMASYPRCMDEHRMNA